MLDCIVIQFAKFPRLGGVKTRMQPFLTEQQSLDLHISLLKHVNQVLSQSEYFQVLAFDQVAQHNLLDELSKHTPIILQQGSDLGERMKHALNWGLTKARKVVIVGSDCAALTACHLTQVSQQLDTNSHVFIPAEDGGYVLIAATQCTNEIFENIQWGTDQVMGQTREILTNRHVSFMEMESLWDVDRPEDYQRLQTETLL